MIFAFEHMELDTELYELRRAGTRVHLEPQVFDVLAYLVEHNDRVVSKVELLDNVWGNHRFVSESALTSRIKAARRAIGDDGTDQRLIRTVHGRGYRFLAPVATGPPTPSSRPPGGSVADRGNMARHADSDAGTALRGGRGTLPTLFTPFVGRTTEGAALAAALAEHRMVTAIGPGGVGKTRLALNVAAEIAPEYRDGAWFVDLVRVTDAAMVIASVAETVGVPEQRSASIEHALVASLAGREALLVVDNCEHVLDGVRDCIERILDGCPNVTVLATSRSRLLVPYEWVYEVPGLSVTDDGGDAVDLFAARVAGSTGDATPPQARRVAALCRALDGMALAIELAAARFSTLGLDGLEAALGERLRFLTGGTRVADRHRSLRDAIGWSYDLLPPEDRSLLRDVAVLASWFDVDAALAIAGPGTGRAAVADGLARLANDSLLVVERGEPTRYRALETIRQYGIERLADTGELDTARARHEQWCRAEMTALDAAEPDDAWCARFDRVVDDFRLVLTWSASDERRRAQAAALAADIAGLMFLRGRPAEAQRRYEQAADLTETETARAGYLRLAAGAATSRYVGNEALRLLRAASDVATSVGDLPGAARDLAWMSIYADRAPGIMAEGPTADEAAALRDAARELSDGSARAEAAIATATAFGGRKRDPAVLELSQHAVELAHRAGDAITECAALDQLCTVYQELDNIPEAAWSVDRRLELTGTLAVDASTGFEFTDTHLMAADVRLAAGDLTGAGEYADRLARLPFYRDEEHLAISRRVIVDALTGNFDDVVRNGQRFRVGWEQAGRPAAPDLGKAAYAVAMVHGILDDAERRAAWLHITVDLGVAPVRLGGSATGWAPTFDALLALHQNHPSAALDRLGADLDDTQTWTWSSMLWRPWYAALRAEAIVLDRHYAAQAGIERSRHAARHNPIATTIIERAAAIAAGDDVALEQCATTFDTLGCPYQEARTRTIAAGLR